MTGILGGLVGSLSGIFRNFWRQGTIPNAVYRTATYADLTNGKYFAFGSNSLGNSTNVYQYSLNGVDWIAGTFPTTVLIRASATNAPLRNLLVVYPSNISTIYTTTNGTTWTARTGGGILSATVGGGTWDGTRFLFGTSSTTAGIVFSTAADGSSWSTVDSGPSNLLVEFGNGRYLASTGAITTIVRTTAADPTVAASWVNTTMPSSNVWTDFKFGNGVWVAMASGTTSYATSTNGTTWTARTLPSLSGDVNTAASRLVFYNDRFYYWGGDSVRSSTDGISWNTVQAFAASTLDNINGWMAGPSRLVAVGHDSPTIGTTVTLIGEFGE